MTEDKVPQTTEDGSGMRDAALMYAAMVAELRAKLGDVRGAVVVAGDDVTDWQRGYRACAENVLRVLDGES
ncbi:MAG TPA: hypothetical protein VF174_15785 [Micromonosporaceae bacterium]